MADLTQQYAGPLGTELLAYYGMEVLKIETGTIPSKEREAAVHACMNRAKLGATLNLRNAEGKELFKQLVAKSNVVVDNFSSGVLERLGFSYEVLQQINPGIVQAVMPGWGLTGPLKTWVAWGWQLLAYTGIMRLWGYPDSPMETRCKIAWPDRVGSVTMALGVLAALEYQARTGRGQFIEAGMLEAQGAMMGPAILDYTVNGNEWDAMGYAEILGTPYAPYGVYPCAGDDNWIIIACASDAEWQSMAHLIGKNPGPPMANLPPKRAVRSGAPSLIKNFQNGVLNIRQNSFFACYKSRAWRPGFHPQAKICFMTFICARVDISSKPKRCPGARSRTMACPVFHHYRKPMRRGRRRGSASIMIRYLARYSG